MFIVEESPIAMSRRDAQNGLIPLFKPYRISESIFKREKAVPRHRVVQGEGPGEQ